MNASQTAQLEEKVDDLVLLMEIRKINGYTLIKRILSLIEQACAAEREETLKDIEYEVSQLDSLGKAVKLKNKGEVREFWQGHLNGYIAAKNDVFDILKHSLAERKEVKKNMPESENIDLSVEDRTRERLGKILDDLRESAKNAGQSPRGRAINIAITEMEKTAMVVIRSFYADEPYDPRKRLEPLEISGA